MSIAKRFSRWRNWFPVPSRSSGFALKRWFLLEGDRLAVTGALLTFVFATFMSIATVWTFEMQTLLMDTSTIQTILNTFLSGMILLVSIVVSINSIVLSHDMSAVTDQEDRVQGAINFRRDLSELTVPGENPTDPGSFLKVMSRIISTRADALADELEGADKKLVDEIDEYSGLVSDAADQLGAVDETSGAEFAILWKGLGFDYGSHIEGSRTIISSRDTSAERFEDLIDAFELFAIGKEYFKTLYYTKEVSKLSQVLLIIALPAILFNASMIIAVNGQVLPSGLMFGIPLLQPFVAVAFTVSIAPYLVLTAYMLRLSTVARLTASGGIFSLN